MIKSELINRIHLKNDTLPLEDTEVVVNLIIDKMIEAMGRGERIEIRGFGAFELRFRKGRTGRNPKTGESVEMADCYKPHFKPGKALRERVDYQ